MLFLHITSAKADQDCFKCILHTLNFILLMQIHLSCWIQWHKFLIARVKLEREVTLLDSFLPCYPGLMPLTRLTKLKLSSNSAGKVLQSFGSTSKYLHALLLVSCTTDITYHMLLLNFFSSQPQSLLRLELVYCHSHFWALSSLLSTPKKSKRR